MSGWVVERNGETHRFATKTEAENWVEEQARAKFPGSALGRLGFNLWYNPREEGEQEAFGAGLTLNEALTVGDQDPMDVYKARLEEQLEEQGYRLVSFEHDGLSTGEGLANPADPLSGYFNVSYRVEPIDGAEPIDSYLASSLSGGISGMWAAGGLALEEIYAGAPIEQKVAYSPAEDMLADFETFKAEGLAELDQNVIEEGIQAAQTMNEIQLARAQAEAAWQAELNKWASRNPGLLTGSGFIGWDANGNPVSGDWGLGSAINNLVSEGRTELAESLLEAEMGTNVFPNKEVTAPQMAGVAPPQFNYEPQPTGGPNYGGIPSAPVYSPPDRREVRDEVRGIMAALVGFADKNRLDNLTDVYMSSHKTSWENPELGLSPSADVYERIRQSSDYQRIHELRPDTVEEADWVAQRVYLGEQNGLTATRAQRFGVQQATAGAAITDIADAASVQNFALTGQHGGSFFDRIRANSTQMIRNMR